MSREASLEIKLNRDSVNPIELLKDFKTIGWWFRNGIMEYLPLDDNDMFNWTESPLSEEKLFSIITEKEHQQEVNGVILYYQNTDTGITLFPHDMNLIDISVNINRKTIDGKYTDFSWYSQHIAASLEKLNYHIEEIIFTEYA